MHNGKVSPAKRQLPQDPTSSPRLNGPLLGRNVWPLRWDSGGLHPRSRVLDMPSLARQDVYIHDRKVLHRAGVMYTPAIAGRGGRGVAFPVVGGLALGPGLLFVPVVGVRMRIRL